MGTKIVRNERNIKLALIFLSADAHFVSVSFVFPIVIGVSPKVNIVVNSQLSSSSSNKSSFLAWQGWTGVDYCTQDADLIGRFYIKHSLARPKMKIA